MLSWAITFLIIAIVAAVLGFGGIAGTATGIAKILFVVFLVMFVASFFFGRPVEVEDAQEAFHSPGSRPACWAVVHGDGGQ